VGEESRPDDLWFFAAFPFDMRFKIGSTRTLSQKHTVVLSMKTTVLAPTMRVFFVGAK